MALRCDLIIRDATVFDGTGTPRVKADVGVRGDRIVEVGDLSASSAEREVVATGKALAPGFIDAHTHDDRAVLCGPACMLCKMSQGVTTVVVGNCGISLSPVRMKTRPVPPLDLVGDTEDYVFDSFAAYADRLARDPSPVNTYALIDEAVADPAAFGLKNVTTPVWTGNYENPFSGHLNATGKAQNAYLFFDHLHPTATGHLALANAAYASLAHIV